MRNTLQTIVAAQLGLFVEGVFLNVLSTVVTSSWKMSMALCMHSSICEIWIAVWLNRHVLDITRIVKIFHQPCSYLIVSVFTYSQGSNEGGVSYVSPADFGLWRKWSIHQRPFSLTCLTTELARGQRQICTIFHGECLRIEYPAVLKQTLCFYALKKNPSWNCQGGKGIYLVFALKWHNGEWLSTIKNVVGLWNVIQDNGASSYKEAQSF